MRKATHLVSLTLGITPLNECIAPPFTSKVVKFIVERMKLFSPLRELKTAYKPLSLSPLYSNGTPIFKEADSGGMVILSKGVTYKARISAMVSVEVLENVLFLDVKRIASPYGEFLVEPLEILVAELKNLSKPFTSEFRLRILSPMVLSNKLMAPPSFSAKKRIPSMHKLLPSPGYIFSYLAKLWNSNVDPRIAVPKPGGDEWAAYKIGRVADLTLIEINYKLRPITVLYDRKDEKVRKVRGTVGWIHYKLLHPKPKPVFAKLLGLANYMGVGRSRGIGMGQVRVEPLD